MIKSLSILWFIFIASLTHQLSGEGIIGLWKSIDEKTGEPQSIVAIYDYQDKYYGRLIATYDEHGNIAETLDSPKSRAPGVKDNPYYVGLDIIWGLKKDESRYTDGKILDPEEGKIYEAEVWPEDGKLMVRGEIWLFGRNQEWQPVTDRDLPKGFKKPDLHQMVPSIPEVKD